MAEQPTFNELTARFIENGRSEVVGIVLHDTAGNGGHGDTEYLANPSDGRKVSVDFTVERDGSIWKLNPDLDKFYTRHAGRKTKFKGLVNAGVTRGTIGIEITQHVNLALSPIYPTAQIKSVAQLCAWLVDKYELTTSDVTTHRNIITDGTRSDPRRFPFDGENGFWQFYWEAMGNGEEHEVSTIMPKIPKPGQYVVKVGDTLSAIAKALLGKASRWPEIQAANSLPGTTIVPGQVLTIPGIA